MLRTNKGRQEWFQFPIGFVRWLRKEVFLPSLCASRIFVSLTKLFLAASLSHRLVLSRLMRLLSILHTAPLRVFQTNSRAGKGNNANLANHIQVKGLWKVFLKLLFENSPSDCFSNKRYFHFFLFCSHDFNSCLPVCIDNVCMAFSPKTFCNWTSRNCSRPRRL